MLDATVTNPEYRIYKMLERILSFMIVCMTNLMYGHRNKYTLGALRKGSAGHAITASEIRRPMTMATCEARKSST